MLEEPLVSFGREICGDLDAGLRREWLVTNGLGGFASGTITGIPTRRYHGLLVAATRPPAGRRVLVGGLVEWVNVDGERFALHSFEFADGTIDQRGDRLLESFELDGALPVWRFAESGVLMERRVWMVRGSNTTVVRYRLLRGGPVSIEVTPLVTDREFHALSRAESMNPTVEPAQAGVAIRMQPRGIPIRVDGPGATVTLVDDWYRGFRHREEAARGLDSLSDLWAPAAFTATLSPGAAWSLTLRAGDAPAGDVADGSLEAARARQSDLLRRADALALPRPLQQLVLASDQFLVLRPVAPDATRPGADVAHGTTTGADGQPGRTVIAGYHWFADWGRDTMIALPGLALATGRADEAAAILHSFAALVVDGLLPNNLPEGDGPAEYNTVDGALWFVLAIRSYDAANRDQALLAELLPVVLTIVESYAAGTRYGIGVDPRDGLLAAGQRGLQLTWMDARVGDVEITPRIGKPVEVNALWLNALAAAVDWLPAPDSRRARYRDLLEMGRRSFAERFWMPEKGFLADVVDAPAGDETELRPNQVLALSLPLALLEQAQAESILRVVGSRLLTTYGLRSLDPRAPAYRGSYGGDIPSRDGAYHQGTVWTWLIGPYAAAVARYRSTPEALALLEPFVHHLFDAGLGSISELMDGDPPHTPRGAIAQAWGVAEVLRVWLDLVRAAGRGS